MNRTREILKPAHFFAILLLIGISVASWSQATGTLPDGAIPSDPGSKAVLLTYFNGTPVGATLTYDLDLQGTTTVTVATVTQVTRIHTKMKRRWTLIRNDVASNVVELTEALIDATMFVNGMPVYLP